MVVLHRFAGGHNLYSLPPGRRKSVQLVEDICGLVEDICGLVEDILAMVEDISVAAGGILLILSSVHYITVHYSTQYTVHYSTQYTVQYSPQ